MEEALKHIYDFEYGEFKIKFKKLELVNQSDNLIATEYTNDTYILSILVNKELHQISLEVPRDLGGAVNINNSFRTSITSGRLQRAIKTYGNELTMTDFFLVYPSDLTLYDTSMSFYSVLSYFNLYTKYINQIDYHFKLNEKEIKILHSYKIPQKAVSKLKILFNESNITSDLNSKNIERLITLIENPSINVITPLDFIYVDMKAGLENELLKSKYLIRKAVGIKLTKYGKLYSTEIQNIINRYFNFQAQEFRNVQIANDSNALSITSQNNKIYFYKDTYNGLERMRVFNQYFVGFLDPIKTSEGANINIKNELSNSAKITNGDLYITLYNKDFKLISIKYEDYITSRVLSTDNVNYETKTIVKSPNGGYKYFQYGKYFITKDLGLIDYIRTEDSLVCNSTGLIPFLNKTDSVRALLGAHMMEQAIPVIESKPSIVFTSYNKQIYDKTMLNIKSPISGKVKDIFDDYVKIEDSKGNIEIVKNPGSSNTMMSTTNLYHITKNIGESIKKDEPIFALNSFKGKELTLGVPLYTAYTIYRGLTYEDAIVMSESAAKKFAHEQVETIEIRIPHAYNYEFNADILKTTKDIVDKNSYDKFGLIKEGTPVKRGDILFAYYKYLESSNSDYARLSKSILGEEWIKYGIYIKVPYRIPEGFVKSIRVYPVYYDREDTISLINYYEKLNSKKNQDLRNFLGAKIPKNPNPYQSEKQEALVINIEISYLNYPKLSDKFSNRYGSKGVLSKIIPDSEMPVNKDGKPIELILNPLSIAARKNISQMYESYLAKIGIKLFSLIKDYFDSKKGSIIQIRKLLNMAYQTNIYSKISEDELRTLYINNMDNGFLRFEVKPFDKKYTAETLLNILNELGETNGSEILYDPISKNDIENPIPTGYTELMRLHFIAENKAKATGKINYQEEFVLGYGSIREGGQKIGEQELWALMAHGKMDVAIKYAQNDEQKSSQFVQALLALGLKVKEDKS